MAKYKIIPSSRTIMQSPISIGHKAEKGVEAIEFDLTAWVETYGSGTLTVIMRRWGDAIPYPIALEIDENNKATWTLSDIDTAKAGMAYAQLNYVVGDEVVKKSDIYTFRVMDSLTGEGEPPEAYESWLEHLTHLAAQAMAEVLDIEGIVTDKTLTVDGGIADAKATGDALSALEDAVTEETDKLKADLISNNVIRQKYNAVSVILYGTISADGKLAGGTTDGSAYVFNVPEGTTIDYSGGTVYGLFATLPVKNETVAVDGTRHIVPSAKITMPTGANYLVIRASSAPSVLSVNETISEKFDGVTTDLDTIDTTISDLLETGIEFIENGFINANGVFVENNNYKATGFVNCAVGGTFVPYKYRLQMFANTKIAYYDSAKELISVISPSISQSLEYVEGVVPYVDGATYVRFCTGKNAVGYYVKYATIKNYCTVVNEESTNPCDYIGDEISVFNKILCIGDSLTSGTFNYREDGSTGHYINDTKYAYPAYLKKLTGCETTNMGNGGMSSAEWYTAHENDDLSGYDCAIIQLGVNDRIRYTTWGETSETAFTNIINKLKTENKNIKIFVANIIPATSYSDTQYLTFSADLLAWVEATYTSDANVIALDMQQYGHTKDNSAYNCGHLSALGYRRLAQDYKGYIGWYINQNKNVFKEVQFIGTNYYYDPI